MMQNDFAYTLMNPSQLVVDQALIQKYDRPGPRYTSYPTADRFIEACDAASFADTLASRNLIGPQHPLSLYVHIPFCSTICYYCGCNKIATRDHSRARQYIDYLGKEISLISEKVAGSRHVAQVHFGGGTPTFLTSDEMAEVMGLLGERFELKPGEYAIEIDPRTTDREKIHALAKLGFNRMSLGVQDFDEAVQQAVHRIQTEEETREVIDAARESGVGSINIDLIYGLPKQNVISFHRTLERVIALSPERIALYSYAHLPALFKPQRRINTDDLPSAQQRLQIMSLAIRKLNEAGYVYIGMDHFAKPDDELAVAARQGRLHRNFQGYSTRSDCDLLAFGISAISKIGTSYSQNVKTLDEYYDHLDAGQLPVLRGIELNADDLLRRSVIQALMCQFELSIESIEIAHLIDFRTYFASEWEVLKQMEKEKLVALDHDWISITPQGRLLVRVVASVFDRYLSQNQQRQRFSRVI